MSATLLDQFIEPFAACLTPDSAAKIASLHADAATQARVDELAERANRGLLSETEKSEYDQLLAAFHFVTILQAHARKLLREAQ